LSEQFLMSAAFLTMHSFRPPFYGRRGIAHWRTGGSVVITEEYIRLTPNIPSRAGFLWNKKIATLKNWRAELSFRVSGYDKLGGDGLAFWAIADPPRNDGPAYGGPNQWTGLAVFVDTFDNYGTGKTPLITLAGNDGSGKYTSADDGRSVALDSCTLPIRNAQQPVALIVTCRNQVVQVELNIDGVVHKCASASVQMPPKYYFGVSAATGGLSDNHDVLQLSVVDIDNELDEEALSEKQPLRDPIHEQIKTGDAIGAARDDDPEVQQLKAATADGVEQKAHTREEEALVHGGDVKEELAPHEHSRAEEKAERQEWPDPANRAELEGLLARFKQQIQDRTAEELIKEQQEHDANDDHTVENNDPWTKEKPPASLTEIYEAMSMQLAEVESNQGKIMDELHRIHQSSTRLSVDMLTSSRNSAAGMLELIEEQMKDRATKQDISESLQNQMVLVNEVRDSLRKQEEVTQRILNSFEDLKLSVSAKVGASKEVTSMGVQSVQDSVSAIKSTVDSLERKMQTLAKSGNNKDTVVLPSSQSDSDWTIWIVVLVVQIVFAAGLWTFVKYKRQEASKTHLF